MIRELLKAEAQTDAYTWTAVLLAHIAIGSALWTIIGFSSVLLYAAFERIQGFFSDRMLWWDCALDWCGVTLGSILAYSLWQNDQRTALLTIGACVVTALVGAWVRGKR